MSVVLLDRSALITDQATRRQFLAGSALAALVAGCGAAPTAPEENSEAGWSFTDDLGTTIELSAPPERIVAQVSAAGRCGTSASARSRCSGRSAGPTARRRTRSVGWTSTRSPRSARRTASSTSRRSPPCHPTSRSWASTSSRRTSRRRLLGGAQLRAGRAPPGGSHLQRRPRGQAMTTEMLNAQPTFAGLPAVQAGQVAPWYFEAVYSHRRYAEVLQELTAAVTAADADVV